VKNVMRTLGNDHSTMSSSRSVTVRPPSKLVVKMYPAFSSTLIRCTDVPVAVCGVIVDGPFADQDLLISYRLWPTSVTVGINCGCERPQHTQILPALNTLQ
jgi:hypothetical protein